MIQVREAGEGDLEAVADIQVACWQSAYRGMVEDAALDAIQREEWLARRKKAFGDPCLITLVAEIEGKIQGYAAGGASRDSHFPEEGELFALYVRPGIQRGGLGQRLLEKMKACLKEKGYRRMVVKTLATNQHSRAFYKKCGGSNRSASSFSFGGQSYPEVAFVYELG